MHQATIPDQNIVIGRRRNGPSSRALLLVIALLLPIHAPAASNTLTTPDKNSLFEVENAVIKGNSTTLLFWTHPALGDPASGKPCPLNFYTITVQPGLPTASAVPVAKDVCGNGLASSRLLDNGDIAIIATDRLDLWRSGKQISSHRLSALKATASLGVDSGTGIQFYDFTPTGDAVLAIPKGGPNQSGFADAAMVLIGLNSKGEQRWQHQFVAPGQALEIMGMWASTKGGALLRAVSRAADGSSMASPEFLYFFDPAGKRVEVTQLARDGQPDMQALMQMAQTDSQQAFAMLGAGETESIKKLDAVSRQDGGFDVLLHRDAKDESRAGHFLLRIGANGSLQSEMSLNHVIAANGLEQWVDFVMAGNEMTLLSTVLATQPGAKTGRKSYPQNVISWIDTVAGKQVSRLLPLEKQYLDAAMSAGDAGMQYLENLPGGDALLLISVGGKPLAVSRGKLAKRPVLRLDEGTDDLLAYTEASDQRQSVSAKQSAREQRKADKEAMQTQLNADLAAAVGMSPEEFAALSNKDRKEAMVRSGNYDAMSAAGAKHAGAAPSGDAQLQATMAQAQQAGQMQGLSPEMQAQIAAAMAQVQQAMGAGSNPMPAANQATAEDFHFTIADAFKITGHGVAITGLVDSGSVRAGDSVCLIAARIGSRMLKVDSIEIRGNKESASKGDRPGIMVSGIDTSDISPKDELRSSCKEPD